MRHEPQAWCGMTVRGTSRQQECVPGTKRSIAYAVLYWSELIPFYQWISRIILKTCFSRSCLPSRVTKQQILEILLACRHIWSAKTVGGVSGYTTGHAPYLNNHTLHDCHLWYTSVKWYLTVFFHFLKILIF